MADEIELKLALAETDHARFMRHPLLRGATRRHVDQLDNLYYDTGDLLLRRNGIALRLRRKGAVWLQTVKLAGSAAAGLSSRPEWETPYSGHFDFSAIEDPSLRTWLQRPKLLARIVPVCETRFRRVTWELAAGTGAILVTLDRGWVIADGRREPISEVEIELAGAPVSALFHCAATLGERVALAPAVMSKAERGYRLHAGRPAAPTKAADVALASGMAPLAAFRQIALSCLEHLQLNHTGALQTDDIEYVHQMRVATRRLRAALRLFAPALPQPLQDGLRLPMAGLTRQLGRARDLDVLLAEIVAPVVAALPDEPRLSALAGEITNRSYAVRAEVLAALAAPDYGRTLLGAIELLHADAGDPLVTPTLAEFAQHRLRRLGRKAGRLAAAARVDNPTSLHALRIGIKRLRYGLEFFAMLPGLPRRRALQARLATMQEALGKLNDLANAGLLLTESAGHDPQLREAVTLIGGWHGPRHIKLLRGIHKALPELAALRLGRVAGKRTQ